MKFITITPNPSIDWMLEITALSFRGICKSKKESVHCGGKAINVSRLLHRCNEETLAIFTCGSHSGEELKALVKKEGFPSKIVSITGSTRRNIVIKAEDSKDAIKINSQGPMLNEEEWQSLLKFSADCCNEGDCVIAGGSLPPGVPARFYRLLTHAIEEKSGFFVLDASGEAIEKALQEAVILPKIVKMNLLELSDLWNENHLTFAEALNQKHRFPEGPEFLISNGKEGAFVISGNEIWTGSSDKEADGYVVGAGDSLVAGYVRMRCQGKSIEESLRMAIACATATAHAPVHSLALPSEIEKFLPTVVVKKP